VDLCAVEGALEAVVILWSGNVIYFFFHQPCIFHTVMRSYSVKRDTVDH
jgi:hypothetical protein